MNDSYDGPDSFEVLDKSGLFDVMAELLEGWMETHGLELLEKYYDHKKTIGKKKPQLSREKSFYSAQL